MAKVRRFVNHRSVIDRKKGRDISKEPEIVRLKELYKGMTDQEKDRTLDHLEPSKES